MLSGKSADPTETFQEGVGESAKKWREFVAGVAKEGILQPLIVTKGFRVIDGKHRLKAAKELNIEYVRVIIEDIPEDKIPSYITETKLNRDDLKPGQKAALVIRLYYEEVRRDAGTRRLSTLKQNTDSPDLEGRGDNGEAAEILAKKAGVSKTNMYYLLAVYRNRPDLFERVFNGEISINKAYTQMKAKKWTTLSQIEAEKARSRHVTHCANCSRT